MNCFTFRQNKIAPGETDEKNSYMDQIDFINNYYTNCDLNQLKNTALLTIGGVGSFNKPRTLHYKDNLIIENLEYNKIKDAKTILSRVTTEIGNIHNALVDLKVLKKDRSLGLDLSIIAKASQNTIDKMSNISSKIQAYLDDISIHNICIMCCSHGSLIIHFTLLYMAATLEPSYFQKIFTKLRIITYGSPRYLNKNLFTIFGNILSKKNTLKPIGCSAIKSLPYIINCYHVDDVLLPNFKSILPSYFHFPNLANIKNTFTEEEHFKYDITNSLLYVNNTNNYYVDNNDNTLYKCPPYKCPPNKNIKDETNKNIVEANKELNRDIKDKSYKIVKPSELFPYLDIEHSGVYANYHSDINVLYPLFSNSILLNLQYSYWHDTNKNLNLNYPHLIFYDNNRVYWNKTPESRTTTGGKKISGNKIEKALLKANLKPSLKNKT